MRHRGICLLLALSACGESTTELGEPVSARVEIMMSGSEAAEFGLVVGVSVDLTAIVFDRNQRPLDPQPQVEFSSSQPTKVAVTDAGRVTAVDGGWAWVHARTVGIDAYPDSVRAHAVRPLAPRAP
jgi:hypothetical protein